MVTTDNDTTDTSNTSNGNGNGKGKGHAPVPVAVRVEQAADAEATALTRLQDTEAAQALAAAAAEAAGQALVAHESGVHVRAKGLGMLQETKRLQRLRGVSDESMQKASMGLLKGALAESLVECGFNFATLRRAAGRK
jgi:hypothetical protein